MHRLIDRWTEGCQIEQANKQTGRETNRPGDRKIDRHKHIMIART